MMALGKRDEAALRELYERHSRAVFAMAQRIVGHRDLAEEVVQELFLRLWNEPERFQPERGQLRSFLFRQAHSRSIERVRSEEARRRREQRHDREQNAPAYDIEREAWALIQSEVVRDAMAELSPGEREAIELAYFGGHSYRDVAAMLDVPEGTIKSRIRVGLSRLHVALAAAGLAALIVVVLLATAVARSGSGAPEVTTADGARGSISRSADPGQVALRDDARVKTLRGVDGLRADVAIGPDGAGVISAVTLPPLATDHVYQLWSLDAGTPTPVATFGAGPAAFPLVRGALPNQLAVTVEPAGGSPAPTATPIVQG